MARVPNGPFLHLTSSESCAGAVRDGLRLVGRDEEVEYAGDDLAVGPLHDVDHGAAARAAWWRRLRELIAQAALDGRGDSNRLDLPGEIRSAAS